MCLVLLATQVDAFFRMSDAAAHLKVELGANGFMQVYTLSCTVPGFVLPCSSCITSHQQCSSVCVTASYMQICLGLEGFVAHQHCLLASLLLGNRDSLHTDLHWQSRGFDRHSRMGALMPGRLWLRPLQRAAGGACSCRSCRRRLAAGRRAPPRCSTSCSARPRAGSLLRPHSPLRWTMPPCSGCEGSCT